MLQEKCNMSTIGWLCGTVGPGKPTWENVGVEALVDLT